MARIDAFVIFYRRFRYPDRFEKRIGLIYYGGGHRFIILSAENIDLVILEVIKRVYLSGCRITSYNVCYTKLLRVRTG